MNVCKSAVSEGVSPCELQSCLEWNQTKNRGSSAGCAFGADRQKMYTQRLLENSNQHVHFVRMGRNLVAVKDIIMLKRYFDEIDKNINGKGTTKSVCLRDGRSSHVIGNRCLVVVEPTTRRLRRCLILVSTSGCPLEILTLQALQDVAWSSAA